MQMTHANYDLILIY